MDKEQALKIAENYAELVLKEFNPKHIMLFGSYHDGTPHEYSDIDIAVIYDKYPGGPLEIWDAVVRLTTLCSEANPPADVDGFIEPHLMDLSDDPWDFAKKVQKTGRPLYSKV